ncbi:MAG TPA: 16S rRNA processing protein RimM [Campylobacterales bacterium]|nr:16S rRNA processing protein RimM [Campylobacterales bacterium]
MSSEVLTIATIGKNVGLKGELKLHLHTDFVEQFKKGSTFVLKNNETVKIQSFNLNRGVVKFHGYDSREATQKLINQKLFTTENDSRESCSLGEKEYFWFDIFGCEVYEDGKLLGVVKDIQRLTACDYLEITTDIALVEKELAKSFLIPYIQDIYIKKVDINSKKIEVQSSLELLEII